MGFVLDIPPSSIFIVEMGMMRIADGYLMILILMALIDVLSLRRQVTPLT